MMVDVVCLALHTMSNDNSKSVGSPLAFAHFTTPRSFSSRWPQCTTVPMRQCEGRLSSWCGVMEGEKWMHVPHGTSKGTLRLFSITTKPLQARRTEFLTDSMAPLHTAFMNHAPGSLGAP